MNKHLYILAKVLEHYYRSKNEKLGWVFIMNDNWAEHINNRIVKELKRG